MENLWGAPDNFLIFVCAQEEARFDSISGTLKLSETSEDFSSQQIFIIYEKQSVTRLKEWRRGRQWKIKESRTLWEIGSTKTTWEKPGCVRNFVEKSSVSMELFEIVSSSSEGGTMTAGKGQDNKNESSSERQ